MSTNYASHVATRATNNSCTPQTRAIPGREAEMVVNNAGGVVFTLDCFGQLTRFLILGGTNTYKPSQALAAAEAAQCVERCVAEDAQKTVALVRSISLDGRAAKQSPTLYVLALLCSHKFDVGVRRMALEAVNDICRTATMFFEFLENLRHFRGRGRAVKRMMQNWYLKKPAKGVAYQVTKYQHRNGWSHRDVLRLCKPKTDDPVLDGVFAYAVGKPKAMPCDTEAFRLLDAVMRANRATTPAEICQLIRDHGLVRECIPTQFLDSPAVWEALLQEMPATALIRNLGKMTNVGLLRPLSSASRLVVEKLTSDDYLRKGRIHPLTVLTAGSVYGAGHGIRGGLTWTSDSNVVRALDAAFYGSFCNIVPSNKRHLLALDVSASMEWATITDTFITPRIGAAAMLLATMDSEPVTHPVAFTSGSGRYAVTPMDVHARMSIRDVCTYAARLPAGGTDCALPMLYAMRNNIEVDTFVIYTDNESWAGSVQPAEALRDYRRKTGIPARLIAVGMTSTNYTVGDPADPGTLNVAGFDSAAPQVMAAFSAGEL